MNPIKVKELHKLLGKAIKEGHVDKFVYLSSDDEGNDYHGLYCEPMTNPEDVRQYMHYSCSGLRNCPEPEKAIIL